MHDIKIPYLNTPLFSPLIKGYIAQDANLKRLTSVSTLAEAIQQQQEHNRFTSAQRMKLADTLLHQHTSLSETCKTQIELLRKDTTYTICTAHQPLLLGGPLYFFHKIISCIKLAQEAALQFPQYHFVPIYWMGSEDHDIDEVNHIHVFGKKLEWQAAKGGPVGNKQLDDSILVLLDSLESILGNAPSVQEMMLVFRSIYTPGKTLGNATREFVYYFFDRYGLLVLDQNDATFKEAMIPVFKEELVNQRSSQQIEATMQFLSTSYTVQAQPREINLFYLQPNIRERIVKEGSAYKVLNTSISFTEEQIITELEKHPERFSPNVILRPLYQEMTLPNIAFVGGAGELAYWLQLKQIFVENKVPFPLLQMRNMALYIDEKSWKRFSEKGFNAIDLFDNLQDLESRYVRGVQDTSQLFTDEKNQITLQFQQIKSKIETIDKTLVSTSDAEYKKLTQSIAMLEAKVHKSLKRKEEESIQHIRNSKQKIFPDQVLQERYDHFSMYYFMCGENYIDTLLAVFQPMQHTCNMLVL